MQFLCFLGFFEEEREVEVAEEDGEEEEAKGVEDEAEEEEAKAVDSLFILAI